MMATLVRTITSSGQTIKQTLTYTVNHAYDVANGSTIDRFTRIHISKVELTSSGGSGYPLVWPAKARWTAGNQVVDLPSLTVASSGKSASSSLNIDLDYPQVAGNAALSSRLDFGPAMTSGQYVSANITVPALPRYNVYFRRADWESWTLLTDEVPTAELPYYGQGFNTGELQPIGGVEAADTHNLITAEGYKDGNGNIESFYSIVIPVTGDLYFTPIWPTREVNYSFSSETVSTTESQYRFRTRGVQPTRSGWVFNSWNTAQDGSGTAYALGAEYPTGENDVSLWAMWERTDCAISIGSIDGERTESAAIDAPINDESTYVRLTIPVHVSGTSAGTLTFSVTATTESTTKPVRGASTVPAKLEGSELDGNIVVMFSNVDTDKKCEFEVTASVSYDTGYHTGADSASKGYTLPVAFYAMHVHPGGHGISFGAPSRDESFNVSMPFKFYERLAYPLYMWDTNPQGAAQADPESYSGPWPSLPCFVYDIYTNSFYYVPTAGNHT